ncbi:MAG: peptidylprolyl isomerase [Sediminibacterium sp.]
MNKTLITLFCCCCCLAATAQSKNSLLRNLEKNAPDSFLVRFKTTKGNFDVKVYKDWSPIGATRFYQLVKAHYYTNMYVFRSTEKYAQFGIQNDSALNSFMDKKTIKDELTTQSNQRAVMAFATGGIDNRTVHIFINKIDNRRLDTMAHSKGFPPFGRVEKGMEVVDQFYGAYKDTITFKYQDSVMKYGNKYLEKHFPGLDKIKKARLKH